MENASANTSQSDWEDNVIPFQVEGLDVRGRAVHLDATINSILDGHDYPQEVSLLLAEAVVLGTLLGTSLKFDGRFTIQTQSDGPVSFFVVDFKTPDSIRAYASYDEERLAQYVEDGRGDPGSLMGKGVLAMTIDQGANMQQYQGIVELDGISLEEIAHQYFRQSEQIPTKIRLCAARLVKSGDNGTIHSWRAGGLMAQFLPDAPERIKITDLPGGDGETDDKIAVELDVDDAWLEASSLVGTIADDELCDPELGPQNLLYRLFHERGVRVFDSIAVNHKCSCSIEKITNIIAMLDAKDRREALAQSAEKNTIISKCEYCGKVYKIPAAE